MGGQVFGQGAWARTWHKWESMTPGALIIAGATRVTDYVGPYGYHNDGYLYSYRLVNLLGQIMPETGYSIEELIQGQVVWNYSDVPIKAHTSMGKYEPAGYVDLVAARLPLPPPGKGYKVIYQQRFRVRYALGVETLSTVLQHVIEVKNGMLVKATATYMHP